MIYKRITEEYLPPKLALLEKKAAESTVPEKWLYGGKVGAIDQEVTDCMRQPVVPVIITVVIIGDIC